MIRLYPLKFKPIYKEKIWGGTSFSHVLGRRLPSSNIGESWDVSAHEQGDSVVENGFFAGRTLSDLSLELGERLLGERAIARTGRKFPLLFKFIDANDVLSVQVHPDDDFAARHEQGEFGKTELWYIVDAKPGAQIVYGLKQGVTRCQFEEAIQRGGTDIVSCLNHVQVKRGDVFSIPAGLVHALGKGIVIAEIQQSSDAVYRVYDWDRVDDNGQPRALHIEKALDVIRFDREFPADNGHFAVEIEAIDSPKSVRLTQSFHIVSCLSGNVSLHYEQEYRLGGGDSCLIPAECGEYSLSGNGTVMTSHV